MSDGRNIDPLRGLLSGEGALQRSSSPEAAHAPVAVPQGPPGHAADRSTYYGLPVIKEPVWIWTVPTYFFIGGLSGAGNVLGAVAHLLGGPPLRPLVVRARWTGAIGDAVGAALLIVDLGRPARFLHMMRVVRVSSPMSLGSWILAGCGAFSAASAVLSCARGPLRRLGDAASLAAALTGLPLAGYTGVLLANTVVPVWAGAARTLPMLFMASAAASAGSFLEMLSERPEAEQAARRFAIVGKAAELAAGYAVEAEIGRGTRMIRPLKRGLSGTLWSVSRAVTAASLGLSLLPGLGKAKRVAVGVLGLAGALALRFAVFQVGTASARDPRATFEQQRPRPREEARGVEPRVEAPPAGEAPALV